MKSILLALGIMMNTQPIKIVTVDSSSKEVLATKTEDIQEDELYLANEISDQLMASLKPYLPAAGLAAPQIGISKSMFIYSYDRDPNHLETVINPKWTPISEDRIEGWEGCFSVLLSDGIWQLASIPRYEKIKVKYTNLDGKIIEKELDGFGAKVFQHECDHLEGLVCIYRTDAAIKSFDSKEALQNFLKEVKKNDSKNYQSPK